MKILTKEPVDFQLRTLRRDDLRRVRSWFAQLKNWDNDDRIRNLSHKLPDLDVYVLNATDGFRIFFSKDEKSITILDIATKETIDLFAGME